ncbi:Dabb family protein [Neobacillus niacini]|uniref:Dabb family protein n=1 Tax=Neobacillus niacini TaxID=86668 RepID=UPI002FFD6995
MIQHVVLIKENENLTDEVASSLISQLQSLNQIPEVNEIIVGTNFSKLSRDVKIGMIAKFPDKNALKIYNKHELHLKVVNRLLELKLEMIVVDFPSTI